MKRPLILLSMPHLRRGDLALLPSLADLAAADLVPSFPALTCCVQSNLTSGTLPGEHGVVANGLYLRQMPDRPDTPSLFPDDPPPTWPVRERLPYLEMWTAPNACVERPQIWDLVKTDPGHASGSELRCASWFPLHGKFCGADFICTPAPIHNPDGSESLWCYTRPRDMYGMLRDRLGHFPLQNYWGPLAGIAASRWIIDSALIAMAEFRPDFFSIYLPALDYAAQKHGPDSPEALKALRELDPLLARLRHEASTACDAEPLWLIAGEYAITPVDHVVYPNRILRDLGTLLLEERDGRERLNLAGSRAFALCDHQISHVYVNEADPVESELLIRQIAGRFRDEPGIDEVLVGPEDLARYGIDHERSGELVLISTPNSWQAYYFWTDDARAPEYARTVDIHRKPGYDPVEMFWDRETAGVPLDATLVKGSHGAPVRLDSQKTVLLAGDPGLLVPEDGKPALADTDVFKIVMKTLRKPS